MCWQCKGIRFISVTCCATVETSLHNEIFFFFFFTKLFLGCFTLCFAACRQLTKAKAHSDKVFLTCLHLKTTCRPQTIAGLSLSVENFPNIVPVNALRCLYVLLFYVHVHTATHGELHQRPEWLYSDLSFKNPSAKLFHCIRTVRLCNRTHESCVESAYVPIFYCWHVKNCAAMCWGLS